MELSEAAQVAAIAGVVITFLLLVATITYRIGRLAQQVQDLKESQTLELNSFRESQAREVQEFKAIQSLEMQSLRQDVQSLEQRMNQQHEVLRSDIQRLFDAITSIPTIPTTPTAMWSSECRRGRPNPMPRDWPIRSKPVRESTGSTWTTYSGPQAEISAWGFWRLPRAPHCWPAR